MANHAFIAPAEGVAIRCTDCGADLHEGNRGTGYGTDAGGAPCVLCYACCGEREAARMGETGRAVLYLVKDAKGFHAVTDWPGTLRFPATAERMRHPFAREAYCGRFTGPDGKQWSYKNIGDSQIAHCRRLKG